MTQASSQLSLNGSRLVRCLTELAVTDVEISHSRFAGRLGQLIDLADSITLSSALGKLPTMAFEPAAVETAAVTDKFLGMRTTIMRSVIRSFDPCAGGSRIKLPVPRADSPSDTAAAYEPYLRFYRAHQREFDLRIQRLQLQVREAATGFSPELAQLAALDSVLGDTLALHTRKFFTVIPRLLGKHFEQLAGEYPPMELHEHFCDDMQGLLLAEIETRLLPVLGLIEALNTHTEKNTYE